MANKKQSAAPNSLKIERKKNKYTFSWTLGEKYTDQDFEYKVNRIKKTGEKWISKSISKSDKKVVLEINGRNIDKILFRVRGKANKKTISKWVDYTMQISPPNKPKVSVSMTADNAATFAFEAKDEEKKPIYWLEWQAVLSTSGETPALKTGWGKLAKKDNNKKDFIHDDTRDGKKIQYKASGSWSHTESFTTGWVRHFKVRAVGAGGESAWVATKQVYNRPNMPKNIECSNISQKNGRITMKVTWDSDTSKAHPIKQSNVQYYIGKLGPGLAPSGGSWQDAPGGAVKDFQKANNKKDNQSASIRIDAPVEIDQCLWIRVINQYASLLVESDPVRPITKPLASPTINSVDYDETTYRVSISATNNSEAHATKMIVKYYDDVDSPNSGKIIGVINSSQGVTLQCPDWTGCAPISFSVTTIRQKPNTTAVIKSQDSAYFQGFILSNDTSMISGKQYYSAPNSKKKQPVPVDIVSEYPANPRSKGWFEDLSNLKLSTDTSVVSGKTYYCKDNDSYLNVYKIVTNPSGNPSKKDNLNKYYNIDGTVPVGAKFYTYETVAKSDESKDGGTTPIAPSELGVNQINNDGVVQVTWDVPWNKAKGAEIAWADHADALYSTNGPSTYEISNIKQAKLNIADLELGKIWYFWARLYSVNESGNHIYSEYSPMASINLASAPAIPNFEISPGVVPNTPDTTFTCSWDFESSDGTDQVSAAIYEVIEVEGQTEPDYILFDSDISTQRTKEYKVSDLVGSRSGWIVGSTHMLTVEVMSEGGMVSERSAAMPISIADPIELNISGTSLISTLNPITYSGTTISEVIDSSRDIYQAEVEIPYTGDRYNAISMAQTAGEITSTVFCTFGTGDSYPEVGYFYGGTYNLMTGVLTAIDSSDGTPYETPKISTIDPLSLTVNPGQTNTFVTNALKFQSVASPAVADIENYYELDTLTSTSVNQMNLTAYDDMDRFTINTESMRIVKFSKDFKYTDSGTTVEATPIVLMINAADFQRQGPLFHMHIQPTVSNCTVVDYTPINATISIPIPDLVVGTDSSFSASVAVTNEAGVTLSVALTLSYSSDILEIELTAVTDSNEDWKFNIYTAEGKYNWDTLYYVKTTDTELDPEKTYYELVDSRAVVHETIATCDNRSDYNVLRNLPLQIWVNNLSESEIVDVYIYREKNFVPPTPDENEFIGYAGETAFIGSYRAEELADGPISIDMYNNQEEGQFLNQPLNDEGTYILQISASDSYGQTTEPVTMPFVVNWENQAVEPDGEVTIEDNVAYIRALRPVIGPNDPPHDFTGDTIDIYRLSGDKPTLIFKGASFYDDTTEATAKATTYVDPYPTIGSRGGYRIVLVTRNGDYIANVLNDDNVVVPTPAWADLDGHVDSKFQFIDFGDQHLDFIYNVDYDSSWNKSFTLTHYLGGSIQGDWLAGVERSGNIKGMTFDDIEPDTYDTIRDLAEYVGLCHIRTIDGSNYTGNVTVSDSSGFNKLAHQHDISLSVQRCDNPELDGMTQQRWEELNS